MPSCRRLIKQNAGWRREVCALHPLLYYAYILLPCVADSKREKVWRLSSTSLITADQLNMHNAHIHNYTSRRIHSHSDCIYDGVRWYEHAGRPPHRKSDRRYLYMHANKTLNTSILIVETELRQGRGSDTVL